jgi:nitroreductase
MDINDLIRSRRAVPPRFFNGNDIPDELVRQLLENATWAPNHKHTEPWRFLVFKGKPKGKMTADVKEILSGLGKSGIPVNESTIGKFIGNLEKSSVVIILLLERDEAHRIPEWEEIAAVSCGVQNMWLTATALGMAAFWSTPGFTEYLREYFGNTDNQKCLGFFLLGYTDIDYPSPGRTPVAQKMIWK